MKGIGVYVPGPGSGYRRIGGFTVNDDGVAVPTGADPAAAQQLHDLAAQVAPRSLKRRVAPSEGERFLEAMVEQFRSSSYIRVINEQ